MKVLRLRGFFKILAVCCMLWGCASGPNRHEETAIVKAPPAPAAQSQPPKGPPDMGVADRVVTDEEIYQAIARDPSLDIMECYNILARLNIKSELHVSQAIRAGDVLKAPNDYSAYKNWTPLPKTIPQAARKRKFILATINFPFMGWYENGRLVKDTQVSMGRKGEETEAGVYKVEEKDPNHYSRSYRNVFGNDAWMPYAMRIYGRVWIHAGDVIDPYDSRGCIYVPLGTAEELYDWADLGTPVVIVDSLSDLDRVLNKSF